MGQRRQWAPATRLGGDMRVQYESSGVVEDEFLVALHLQDVLAGHGASVIGSLTTVCPVKRFSALRGLLRLKRASDFDAGSTARGGGRRRGGCHRQARTTSAFVTFPTRSRSSGAARLFSPVPTGSRHRRTAGPFLASSSLPLTLSPAFLLLDRLDIGAVGLPVTPGPHAVEGGMSTISLGNHAPWSALSSCSSSKIGVSWLSSTRPCLSPCGTQRFVRLSRIIEMTFVMSAFAPGERKKQSEWR
jgi:hypothetical protein